MLPWRMVELRYYVSASGDEPFGDWFTDLEAVARAKVTRAIARLEQGNFSSVKTVGDTLVILLTGGTKKRQQRDIDAAHAYWRDYKLGKRRRR
jgi:putative component of toxin-antitoxin plasmid stabilization module